MKVRGPKGQFGAEIPNITSFLQNCMVISLDIDTTSSMYLSVRENGKILSLISLLELLKGDLGEIQGVKKPVWG